MLQEHGTAVLMWRCQPAPMLHTGWWCAIAGKMPVHRLPWASASGVGCSPKGRACCACMPHAGAVSGWVLQAIGAAYRCGKARWPPP